MEQQQVEENPIPVNAAPEVGKELNAINKCFLIMILELHRLLAQSIRSVS